MIIKIDFSIIVIVLLVLALIFAAIYLWWIEPLKQKVKETSKQKVTQKDKKEGRIRYCKNCGYSSYDSISKCYHCLNPNPMDTTIGTFPVNEYGSCAWHNFPEEVFYD